MDAPERPSADEPPAAERGSEPVRAEADEQAAPRAPARARDAALDQGQKALVEQAAALVREVVAQVEASATDDSAGPSRRRAEGVRSLKRQVRQFRSGQAETEGNGRLSRRKAARLNRVLATFIGYALSGDVAPGQIRWPEGIDVTAALQDLIRVLAAAQADAVRRPDVAAEDEAAETPDAERLPELR